MANVTEVVNSNAASGNPCLTAETENERLRGEFAIRRRAVGRARAIGIASILSSLPVFGILKDNLGIEAGVAAGLVCLTIGMAVRMYAKSIWKCPACSASLRLDRIPDNCFRCGSTDH